MWKRESRSRNREFKQLQLKHLIFPNFTKVYDKVNTLPGFSRLGRSLGRHGSLKFKLHYLHDKSSCEVEILINFKL